MGIAQYTTKFLFIMITDKEPPIFINKKYKNLSIVIINKNDRGITETLSALIKIDSPIPYEIIVIDASAGKLDDIKRKYSSVNWYDFKPLHYKKRTIPEQRNLGVEKSKGEIIVFIDANCVPTSHWLRNLVSPILISEEHIVAGGTVSKYKATLHDRKAKRQVGNLYINECATINLAFSKDVYSIVGKFDEDLTGAEDLDFSWRAVDAGYRIRYIPEAKVTHDWGGTKDEIIRAYRYGATRVMVYKKHLNHLKKIFKEDFVVVIYPIYLLGLPITILFWPYPLLILIPILKNTNQRPLKTVGYNIVFAVGILRELIRL